MKPDLFRSVISLGIMPFLSEYDVEDGVRAAARLIHVGGGHSPVDATETLSSAVGSLHICPAKRMSV